MSETDSLVDAKELIQRMMRQEADDLAYATRLATWMARTFYREESPNWKPLDSVSGVLSQIDNMLTGLEKKRERNA